MPRNYRRMSRFGLAAFKFSANTLLAGYYRRFVAGLGLAGRETVLELGSGTGAASRFLAAALAPGGRLICTDVSGAMQQEARQVLQDFRHVEFWLGETAALDLPADTADLAVIHFVLHDIEAEARPETLAALHHALKPGGRLIIREPLGRGHGMPAAEIQTLLAAAGYQETESAVRKPAWWRGKVFTGWYRK